MVNDSVKAGGDSPVKVTVLVMTYNHALFIEQALESALSQETDFRYEILISEDCSTDGTREKVIHYCETYPKRVRSLLSPRNIRSNAVVARGIRAAAGEYIALLDGDDYWTSARKLQKQADFLDRHQECSMCFHNAQVIHEDGDREPWNWTPEHQDEITTLDDIWMGNYIATCSTMFRRNRLGEVPEWYDALFPITDWPLHILNAQQGAIGYINEVLGVYRYHGGGLYSPHGEAEKQDKTLNFYRVMNANFHYQYNTLVGTAISKYFAEWAEEYQKRGDIASARRCFRRCLEGTPVNKYVSRSRLLRLGAKLYAPGLLSMKKRMVTYVNGIRG